MRRATWQNGHPDKPVPGLDDGQPAGVSDLVVDAYVSASKIPGRQRKAFEAALDTFLACTGDVPLAEAGRAVATILASCTQTRK